MSITIFSFVVAVLWCNVYIAVVALIRKRDNFLIRFSYIPLLFLIFAAVFRILYSGEFPYTVVIRSEVILTAIYDFLTAPLFTVGENSNALCVYHILIVVWVIGSAYFLSDIVRRQLKLRKMLKDAPRVDDMRIVSVMKEVVRESGKNTKVEIRQPDWNLSPMIAGYFKPAVLMSEIPFSDDELKLVLQHEWAHFLHKDLWTKLFMNIMLAIFWWNPFVRVLRNDLNHILEVKCDLNVVSKLDAEERDQYLKAIAKIMDKVKESKPNDICADFLGLIGTNSTSKGVQRVRLITQYKQGRSWRAFSNTVICVVIAMSFMTSYVFMVQPAYHAKDLPDYGDAYTITLEGSYLMLNEDGTYAVYLNGKYESDINSIVEEPFASFPIKN